MTTGPSIAVFASDKGPGDAERTSFMSQAGLLLARKGAHIICMAEGNVLPVPLIASARTAGGEITIVAGEEFELPAALSGITVERFAEHEQQWQYVADLCEAIIGLPGSLVTANNMFNTWVAAGAGASGKPVAMLNRNRAFEVLRGLYVDVLTQSIQDVDKVVMFSESMEDLWSRVQRALKQG